MKGTPSEGVPHDSRSRGVHATARQNVRMSIDSIESGHRRLPRLREQSGSMTDSEGVDMDEFTYCPIPTDDGGTCWSEPEPDGYANICHDHMQAIVRAWSSDIQLGRLRCEFCGSLAVWKGRTTRVIYCEACMRVIRVPESLVSTARSFAEPNPARASRRPRSPNVVYYIRFSDRIKIGTTSDLRRRMREIPHEELLAVEPGNVTVEHRRHEQFSKSRVFGEWFTITPDLTEHVSELRRKYGPPIGAWRKWFISLGDAA